MASRLSEDPSVRVGVFEAGETAKNVDIIDVPGLVSEQAVSATPAELAQYGADLGTQYDWNYTTQAQSDIKSMSWPRGKVVGGTRVLPASLLITRHLIFDRLLCPELSGLGFSFCSRL